MRGSCAVHARDTETAMCQKALNSWGSWLSILQAPWYPLVSIAIHNIHWCCQISMNIQNVPDGNWSGDFLRTSSVWALGPNHINYCKQARTRQQDQASEHAKRQSQISNASILSCWAHRYQLPPTLEMYGISWNRMQRCTAFAIFMNLQGFSIIRSMCSLFFLIKCEFHKENERQYTRFFLMFMRGVSFGKLTGAVCDTVAQNKTNMIDSFGRTLFIFMRGSRGASKNNLRPINSRSRQ